jgi:LPXTG-motif cell wall-anchored protein
LAAGLLGLVLLVLGGVLVLGTRRREHGLG